jgi:hypothetical protein
MSDIHNEAKNALLDAIAATRAMFSEDPGLSADIIDSMHDGQEIRDFAAGVVGLSYSLVIALAAKTGLTPDDILTHIARSTINNLRD